MQPVNDFIHSILLCIFVHSVWGLQPAACRYLLVFSPIEFNSQAVIAFSRLLSIVLMTMKDRIMPEDHPNTTSGGLVQLDKQVSSKEYWRTLIIFGVLSALRSMTNIFSCGLTSAYNIAIVNLLSPLITPMADKVWLGAEIPMITWQAVLWTSVGCGAMIYGEYLIYGEVDENSRNQGDGWTHVAGVLIQTISVLFSVAIRMMMKTTSGIATKAELMHSANVATVVLGFGAGISAVGSQAVTSLFEALANPFSLSFFWLLFLGAGVYTVGSYLQISCCRLLGPGLYASYSSVRVAVAVLSSSWVLGEDVEGVWVWGGLWIVGITVTWYTREMLRWAQARKDEIINDRIEKHSAEPTPFPLKRVDSDLTILTVEDLIYEKVSVSYDQASYIRHSYTGESCSDEGKKGKRRNMVENVIF